MADVEPVEVTHYLCDAMVGMEVTHHLQPRRDGTVSGEPAFVQKCAWCGKTQAQLAEDIAAHGGTRHPHIVATDPPTDSSRGPRHRR